MSISTNAPARALSLAGTNTGQLPGADIPPLMPESPATEAARVLAARRVGALPVQDRSGRIIGLLSEHDIVRVVASRALGLRGLAVEDVMTRDPVSIGPGTSAAQALALMKQRALRYLPVCTPDGRLLGLVGLGDLAEAG